MANTYLDDFMDKLITVPNDINRLLRLIRKLDKRVQNIQATLITQQSAFLSQVKQLRDKKITTLPDVMKSQLQSIQRKQKELFGYSKEKKEVADQLSHEVAQYQQMLATQLRSKYKDKPEEQIIRRKKLKLEANKTTGTKPKQDFYYDMKDPQYCYCARGSFGQMVACQNPYCQRQWFHTVCIEQKNLPQKWYCSDCQKQRDKTKNTLSRSYFANKQATTAN